MPKTRTKVKAILIRNGRMDVLMKGDSISPTLSLDSVFLVGERARIDSLWLVVDSIPDSDETIRSYQANVTITASPIPAMIGQKMLLVSLNTTRRIPPRSFDDFVKEVLGA